MKNTKLFVGLFALILFISGTFVYAQEGAEDSETIEAEDLTASEAVEDDGPGESETPLAEEEERENQSFHQVLKQKFIEGGPTFMGITAICLVLGLAIAIERILYLGLSTINPRRFLTKIDGHLKNKDVEGAKKLCQNTRGPVASIVHEGLSKVGHGIETIEKSVISYGSIQMSLLEKGVSWISLFIALAPMLGFMGTVIGMIGAFDAIQEAGDISPSLVAGGIKVALLTTVLGLIVAMILQVFYNYIIAKIDSLVSQMESTTIEFVDILIENDIK